MASEIKQHRKRRNLIQLIVAIISNAYIVGFLEGKIYRGDVKAFCVPGLNCYACPGALGSCPIGSLQAVIGSRDKFISWYVGGFLVAVGATLGRFVCGWMCPFGWFQDLLHRIPIPKGWKRRRRLPGEKYLSLIRYGVLVVLVILLPMFLVDIIGQGSPYFCSWVCPSGTLSGLFLLAGNVGLRSVASWLFAWKNLILAITIVASIVVYRPFCRYICPLGAIYGLFNPVSLYRFSINHDSCTSCKTCQKVCKLDIPVFEKPNSTACIRCGDCIAACPHDAILHGFRQPQVKPSTDAGTSSDYPS
ncbi:4Fe-4S binding protein [Pleomorphochaeta sp. DL1XJH-081]|uniref:4Fe-4S binding protein n=1 Tax=Pleomorphochaeta sp. DL1XJH-081 TaxID=3409690 RepID=UPI003BB7363F